MSIFRKIFLFFFKATDKMSFYKPLDFTGLISSQKQQLGWELQQIGC